MRFTAVFVVALAALALSGPVSAAKNEGPVKATSANNLKGTQKIVIGQFTVGFLIERKDSAKAGGGLMGNGFGGRSTVRSTLAGYTPQELQQIADAAHDDFVAKLTSAGFEVGDRGALTAHPAVAKLSPGEPGFKEMTTITGRDDKAKVLFVGATQTGPLRLLAGDVVASGFGAMGLIMSGTQVTGAHTNFAKDSGTRVINVVYYVDFAESEEYGGWFRSSSAVKVNGSLALMPDQSKVSVIGPNYKSGSLALRNPIAVGGDFFDKRDTMSGGEKASNAIGNAIGLLGGAGTNSSKKFTFMARPGYYASGATQATAEGNTIMAQQLAAYR